LGEARYSHIEVKVDLVLTRLGTLVLEAPISAPVRFGSVFFLFPLAHLPSFRPLAPQRAHMPLAYPPTLAL
jgi:hypothetical protein